MNWIENTNTYNLPEKYIKLTNFINNDVVYAQTCEAGKTLMPSSAVPL
jgi:hypothetical protein